LKKYTSKTHALSLQHARNLCWGPENLDAQGVDVEEEGYEDGVFPSPLDYGVWVSVGSSTSEVRGRPSADNEFWCILSLNEHI